MLHTYRSTQFHITSNSINPCSGFRDMQLCFECIYIYIFFFWWGFHQKWHFAHPKISFAHFGLPFLAIFMLPRMHDDMLANAYKHSMPTTNTHMIKNIQTNIFHKFESLNGIIPPSCTFRIYPKYVFQIYKMKYENKIRGIPMVKLMLYLVHLPVGFMPTMHSFYYDDVMAIKLSNWQRRKFPEHGSHDDVIKWKHFPRYWRPVTQSFDVFFDLRLDGRLSKHSCGWWLETPSCPLWCQSNDCGINEAEQCIISQDIEFSKNIPTSAPEELTHWARDKMADIFQTTYWNAFSWIKILEFRIQFDWNLFLRVQFTIIHHRFR